jgi:hypothetical protein
MQRPGDELLSGAAFPGDQHGGLGVGDLLDFRVDILHRRAFPDEIVEGVTLGQLRAQLEDFPLELAGFQSLGDNETELFDVERLRQVVSRAELHGLHGGFDGLGAGEHDDGHAGVLLADHFQQRQTVHAWHDDVQQDQMGGFSAEQIQPLLRGGRAERLVGRLQHDLQRRADARFVIDQQDPFFHAPRAPGRTGHRAAGWAG